MQNQRNLLCFCLAEESQTSIDIPLERPAASAVFRAGSIQLWTRKPCFRAKVESHTVHLCKNDDKEDESKCQKDDEIPR